MRNIQAVWLAIQEALSSPTLARVPEPTPDMSGSVNVQDFHAQGSDDGALLPIYHFNALNIHALTPSAGVVVDLGCGSGQCLAHLARCRPDLTIVGWDLSQEMVSTGNRMLQDSGLSQRVQLRSGDMTHFVDSLPTRVDTICSTLSLHHLPTPHSLALCLNEIGLARKTTGAAVWILDLARPKRKQTAERFPRIFSPQASPYFQADSRNSLVAAWCYEELQHEAKRSVSPHMHGQLARLLRLFQIHWIEPQVRIQARAQWTAPDITPAMQRDTRQFAALFGDSPISARE